MDKIIKMENINKLLVIALTILMVNGCASTQSKPENLDKFTPTIRSAFVSYKNMASSHKAFAVAKFKTREFYGFGYSYPTIAKAEKQALDKCHELAKEYKDDLTCFIYHSE